jgi:UDP-2,3-diacylglucosamine pyrophosphatase LpxH
VVVEEARRNDVDGIICGHIHHAAIEQMGSVRYINTGDWVESCTAVAEHFDGSFEIITWADAASPIHSLGLRAPADVDFPAKAA